jgi:formylglycine-generating enzyme required for sulfatase activity
MQHDNARTAGARRAAPLVALLPVLMLAPATPAQERVPPAAGSRAGEPSASERVEGQPYVERIAGTTVSIAMVPVPRAVDEGTGGLWMSATEITWDAYDVLVFGLDRERGGPDGTGGGPDGFARPSKPYITMDRGFGHAGHPAISVSLEGAEAFCAWLSAKTGRRYRLPTEAEWERACRAGSRGAWCCGDDAADLDHYAWHAGNAGGTTHPVGEKRANALGLYDVHGNAAEWCLAAGGGKTRGVVRGGSYKDGADGVRADARVEPSPAWNASDPQIPKSRWWLADAGFVGFRIVGDGAQDERHADPGAAKGAR